MFYIYRVILKSLRDFRPPRYNSRDGHAEGEHVNRGRYTASFCPTLQVLDICTLGDATDVKFGQIPRHTPLTYSLSTPCFVTTAPLAVKPENTPRRLVQKKNLERFSVYWYAPFCRVCLCCLLRSRVRKSRRDLGTITCIYNSLHVRVGQRLSNCFQVGTTFISQNVLRTTLLLSPLKANLSFF
jgi:hypothetical protein